jgi:hypothetical protein
LLRGEFEERSRMSQKTQFDLNLQKLEGGSRSIKKEWK